MAVVDVKEMINKLRQITVDLYGDVDAKLAIIQVGDNPASNLYVKSKKTELKHWFIEVEHIHLPEDATEEDVLAKIEAKNLDKDTSGIIVQLPLPKHINEQKVISAILPSKNVDGFSQTHTVGMADVIVDSPYFKPCTPAGIMHILKQMRDIRGKTVCLIGRGKTVGEPLIKLLSKEPCTLICCNSNTTRQQLEQHLKVADIVITAVGQPHLFDNRDLKYGALVIDAGISYIDGKQTGDYLNIDFHKNNIDYTPHLGGVGKMTVAMLAVNTYRATML